MGTNDIGRNLELVDPFIHRALQGEKHRQQTQIELIASENTVSRAVLQALEPRSFASSGIRNYQ